MDHDITMHPMDYDAAFRLDRPKDGPFCRRDKHFAFHGARRGVQYFCSCGTHFVGKHFCSPWYLSRWWTLLLPMVHARGASTFPFPNVWWSGELLAPSQCLLRCTFASIMLAWMISTFAFQGVRLGVSTFSLVLFTWVARTFAIQATCLGASTLPTKDSGGAPWYLPRVSTLLAMVLACTFALYGGACHGGKHFCSPWCSSWEWVLLLFMVLTWDTSTFSFTHYSFKMKTYFQNLIYLLTFFSLSRWVLLLKKYFVWQKE